MATNINFNKILGVKKIAISITAPLPPPIYFTTTWTTTIPNETITLPYDPAGTYSGTIDWGDHSTDVNSFANSSHTYALAGTYTVEIIGDCMGWNFGSYGSATYITSVVHWGQLELGANNGGYFNGCTNLDLSLVSDILNLENITNLYQMFANSNTITINNINLWDTGQVTSMSSMFNGATNFNQALSFNTENVNDMNSMFANASSFNGILSLSTGAVTDMGNMFYNASSFNQPLAFVTDQVVNMNAMFYGATNFNQNIGAWDVSIVNDFQDFMGSKTPATFSTANLDAIYNGWHQYDVLYGLGPVDFGTAKYSPAGIAGRAILTGVFLWNINDGGL